MYVSFKEEKTKLILVRINEILRRVSLYIFKDIYKTVFRNGVINHVINSCDKFHNYFFLINVSHDMFRIQICPVTESQHHIKTNVFDLPTQYNYN